MNALVEYFRNQSSEVLRPPSGCLHYPFIVPGSVYHTQLWDWDSYWTGRGLFELSRWLNDSTMHAQIVKHAKGCVKNFFEHQSESGAVPILMQADCHDRFDCLKDVRGERNQAKPVLGQFALLIAEESKDWQWCASWFDHLMRFYTCWEKTYRSRNGLLVWGSDVAIGVDNDPTTYGRPAFSSANMLLNSLYEQDLRAAEVLARRLNRRADAELLSKRAEEMGQLMRTHCWDERDQFFYTQDVQCEDHRAELIPWANPGMPLQWSSLPLRIQMFTGFLPLWNGVATTEQAASLVRYHLKNSETFAAAYGVRSLSQREKMFSLAASGNPSNWLGPVWILTNYMIWKGLRRYDYRAEAAELMEKTVRLLESDLKTNGALHEYYHPDTGAPLMNRGFYSWNILVLEMIREEKGETPCVKMRTTQRVG